jgi:D-alanyl-D-alanine carboxypeptidase
VVSAVKLASLVAAAAVTTGAAVTPPQATYMHALQKLADRNSGAVAIVVTPKGTWKGAVGWADPEARRRADPDDRFAIESTTKTFVATVVLQLAAEGRLSLDDTVQHWLPGLLAARPAVTVRQMLSHTSGLVSDFGFSQPPMIRAKRIAAQGLGFKPGTMVAYSNSDFVVLGLIVEKVTGRNLDRVVTSKIIQPLHLRSTSYGTEQAQRMTPWLGQVESFGRPVSGDGGIISTVQDLATFFRALLGGKLLPPQQLAEMKRTIATTDPDFRFGLGIFRSRSPCGIVWGHGGLASYNVNVVVAGDGAKAVITAQNNPSIDDSGIPERMYCS